MLAVVYYIHYCILNVQHYCIVQTILNARAIIPSHQDALLPSLVPLILYLKLGTQELKQFHYSSMHTVEVIT